ncbi:unnamed protein product [Brassicogethes aeneus]|uniref:beta-glucosidase n=1 Tax=Brassicogethes aeneus TaxID=1431903 RepID=A0A9P0FGH6_BRAAE|nr:unnamed protein product [Brassicogethes aeneus]
MQLFKCMCYILSSVSLAAAVSNKSFPASFKFGTATASYQIEGAWNEDGKGENIWDRLTHTNPTAVKNSDNGDIACDSYHKYREDVRLLKDLGVKAYRFSISWPRILPTGFTNKVNKAGIQYYKNLIKELQDNGIEPMATLYHWDLPQPLQDIGGWPNDILADHFGNYARICFEAFGDSVKTWFTINEPHQICQLGYGSANMAPLINSSGVADYLCAYTVIKAHAKAWHIYDDEFRGKQGGRISIFGLYANAIFLGNWPQVVIDRVEYRSKKEGYAKSRLPKFTEEEVEYIKGTYDFVGYNTYTTSMVRKIQEPSFNETGFEQDTGSLTYKDPTWETTSSDWINIVPWGTRKFLSWLKNTYNNPEIIITENGLSDDSLEDDVRIHYYTEYLSAILEAIHTDKVNVSGYIAWSLLDNYEWLFGYTLTAAVSNKSFPASFKFGTATASYQIEGAWNEDGKGENIWDRLTHTNPTAVKNSDNGDIACDSYHKYRDDVRLLKDLGVKAYRFSISWSRILPTGFTNKVNKAGIQYYKNLIKELLDNGIEPMATLYHWDLPQPLQDIGGWPNDILADHFANYARICFEAFGDSVKTWFTFNEAKQTCQQGYGTATMAPLIKSPGVADYLCTYTVLKAHAKAWHIYDDEFRGKQGGRISIVIDSDWFEPATDKKSDLEAAETRRQFSVVIDRVDYRSKREGYAKSRLPKFTEEEVEYIKGTHDFLGFNTYTTSLVSKIKEPSFNETGYIVPWGTRKFLSWLKNTYNNPEIIITENGVSDDGRLDDDVRIHYYTEYLSAILEAIHTDKVNVSGYLAWSLLDNFEWLAGYTEKFGLYHVDFSSPNRTRTAKKSVGFFKKIVASHCLVEKCVT